ncbi:DUF6457 domain-containing protein [Leucobacter sp. USHLN153]|uniref:DUF6457 domain-containing protein n=1 Tax=Leucobacter sp. USHLN153 TaxID=3081268 RepID=UPI0030181A78
MGRESGREKAGALHAIVLAGGRGSRLGGVDKAEIRLGDGFGAGAGERLVDRVVAGARSGGAQQVVVVGADRALPEGCIAVREDPPYSGPLAALAAALPLLPAPASASEIRAASGGSDEVLLLSCDLVEPAAVVAALSAAPSAASTAASLTTEPADAVVLVDPGGREQWLAGRYRLAALREGIAALQGETANGSLRSAFRGMAIRRVSVERGIVADIDTPEDLERARRRVGADSRSPISKGARMSNNSKHLPPEALDEWLAAAAERLGLGVSDVSIGTVLDVARDVAHDVARPAAPLSTFLLGLAVGRAGDPEALRRLAAELTERAAEWKAAHPE